MVYKSVLLDEEAYSALREIKDIMSKNSGKSISFSEVIHYKLGRELSFEKLDLDVKNYVLAFAEKLSREESIYGALLFGSVARNSFKKYSDIDIMIIIGDKPFNYYVRYIHKTINQIENSRKRLVDKDLHLYISPLLIKKQDLNEFMPLYLDMLEDGIILYQKNNILSSFLENLNKIKYKRIDINGSKMLEWNLN